jgi:hypothetical protein
VLLEPGGRSSGPLYCSVGCLSGQFGLLDCGALDTAPLWRYGIRRRRGNVACCQLASQYTARLGSAESSVDDFDNCRGDVLIRAVTILRYIESQFQCNVYGIYRMAYFNGVFNGSNTIRYFSW